MKAVEKPAASMHWSRVLRALQPRWEPLGMQWRQHALGKPTSAAQLLLCCLALPEDSAPLFPCVPHEKVPGAGLKGLPVLGRDEGEQKLG